MSDAAIRLDGITKTFGNTEAVRDLDLVVPAGTICGLLGPNGAGKTTTLRIILDIVGPDSGSVEVLGRRVDDHIRSRIGYLPEERGLYQKMRVAEHLAFFGELKGLRHADAMREARRWLDRLELGARADDRVESLSKGMQQKVQFIATILHRPDLLILDEPFAGLDPINVDLLKQIVLERKREGATVLFSTHMIEDAERLCERVCMIAGARKVLDGTVAEVRSAAGRRDVAISFDGDGGFLSAPDLVQSVSDQGRYVEVRLRDGTDHQELLRRAVEAGVRISRFELIEPSLREIFLERAGRRTACSTAAEDGTRC
ncbi:MAG: ABC transporter ATP-binding protein [Gemmatimonadota bacterium]